MSENISKEEKEAHSELRANVAVERLIHQYDVDEIADITHQLEEFLGLFKKQSA